MKVQHLKLESCRVTKKKLPLFPRILMVMGSRSEVGNMIDKRKEMEGLVENFLERTIIVHPSDDVP